MTIFFKTQVDEFVALADPSLSLLSADQESALDEIPQNKITDFRCCGNFLILLDTLGDSTISQFFYSLASLSPSLLLSHLPLSFPHSVFMTKTCISAPLTLAWWRKMWSSISVELLSLFMTRILIHQVSMFISVSVNIVDVTLGM